MDTERTIVDYTDKVKNWLWQHGKLHQHNDEEASGRRINVWEVPESKKAEFKKLFERCSTTYEDRHDFYELPTEVKNIKLFCDGGEDEGPFKYHMAGYNYDGFYERGEQGVHNCSSYISCYPVHWYLYRKPWSQHPIEQFTQDINNRNERTIIAFMPEKETK